MSDDAETPMPTAATFTKTFSEPEDATQEVMDWTNQAKPQVEKMVSKPCECQKVYPVFDAKLFIKETGPLDQTCEYYVKVYVGDTEYVHINMCVGLTPDVPPVNVQGVKEGMEEYSKLEPFGKGGNKC